MALSAPCTHVDDQILGVVGVSAAHIEPAAVPHRLDHPNVVPTVVVLQMRKAIVSGEAAAGRMSIELSASGNPK